MNQWILSRMSWSMASSNTASAAALKQAPAWATIAACTNPQVRSEVLELEKCLAGCAVAKAPIVAKNPPKEKEAVVGTDTEVEATGPKVAQKRPLESVPQTRFDLAGQSPWEGSAVSGGHSRRHQRPNPRRSWSGANVYGPSPALSSA
jgi:hypothetical protein